MNKKLPVITIALTLLLAGNAVSVKQFFGEPIHPRPLDAGDRTTSREYTWATTEATDHGAPHWMGDPNYWGDAECAIYCNDVGVTVTVATIRFMCTNDDADSSYWGVNNTVTGYEDTAGLESIYISEWAVSGLYTPAEGYTGSPPVLWTEVDVGGWGVTVADGAYFAVAYGLDEDETANGSLGLTDDAGERYTYSVYAGAWDWDQDPENYDPATAVLNAVVTYAPVSNVVTRSYGKVKALFR